MKKVLFSLLFVAVISAISCEKESSSDSSECVTCTQMYGTHKEEKKLCKDDYSSDAEYQGHIDGYKSAGFTCK